MKSDLAHPLRRHLWFKRSGSFFAVPVEHLQEALLMSALRPLPAAEPALAGFIVLRERVLPILDPLSIAGMPASGSNSSAIVIALALHSEPVLGLLAEEVGKVVELPAPAPLTKPARIPKSFAGEFSGPDAARLMIFDVAGLAAVFGLTEGAAAPEPVGEPLGFAELLNS